MLIRVAFKFYLTQKRKLLPSSMKLVYVNERACYKLTLANSFLVPQFVFSIFFLFSDRTQRLRDARTEALAEIEALKKQKEQELLENDKRVSSFPGPLAFVFSFSLFFLVCCGIGGGRKGIPSRHRGKAEGNCCLGGNESCSSCQDAAGWCHSLRATFAP